MLKPTLLAVGLLAASPALGQASQQPQQNPPQQQPAAQPPPPQPSQPQSQSTAGSQGQSSTAQPSSPGASSQQVVVNPPPSQQPSVQQPNPPPPANPPSSTTIVNPPPGYEPGPSYAQDEVVVRRRPPRDPVMTVATDALYGGLAGLLIGFGVGLVNNWDHWERDLTVGAGVGILAGGAVGAVQAAYDQSEYRRRRVAGDGMNRTDKDPVVATRPAFALGFKF